MIKKIKVYHVCIVILLLLKTSLYAQNQSPSAYTSLGIGRIEKYGLVKNQGMGGAGLALPTDNFVNVLNPASLTGVDSLKMLIDMGLNVNLTHYESKDGQGNAVSGGLNNITMAFRLTPILGTSFGISQYSQVGYNISSTAYIDGTLIEIPKTYEGSGGIDQVYLANAISISKNLSLGLKMSYLFGKISKSEIYTSEEIGGGLRLDYSDYLQQVQFETGIQYHFQVEKNTFSLGAVYAHHTKFNTLREVLTASSGGAGIAEELEAEDYALPTDFAVGVAWMNISGFKSVFDYRYQNWAGISYIHPVAAYQDLHRFSGGFEYRNSNTRKAAPFLWQVGAYHEDSYLKVQGNALIDKGITLGVGIPVRNYRSYLNLSFNYGTRGTRNNALITENYYGFSLSMSMVENWFKKRQFD
ncbi:hypothetical protein E9993_12230 [Labilibacter sediminis]|nr:hypothetical protein E9993_12230 [Labilibacter sediminis]